jgi:hypothetical protein
MVRDAEKQTLPQSASRSLPLSPRLCLGSGPSAVTSRMFSRKYFQFLISQNALEINLSNSQFFFLLANDRVFLGFCFVSFRSFKLFSSVMSSVSQLGVY